MGPDLNVPSKLNSLDTVEGHFLRARTGIIKVKAGFLLTQCPLCHSDAAHRRLDISIKCFKRYNYHFRGMNEPHFPFPFFSTDVMHFFGAGFWCTCSSVLLGGQRPSSLGVPPPPFGKVNPMGLQRHDFLEAFSKCKKNKKPRTPWCGSSVRISSLYTSLLGHDRSSLLRRQCQLQISHPP